MTLNAPAVRSRGAIQGQQTAVANSSQDNSGGVRSAWWWKAGRVDSCCFFFTLRTGVGLLAAFDIVKGILDFVFLAMYTSEFEQAFHALERERMLHECYNVAIAHTEECREINDALHFLKGIYKPLLAIVRVEGFFCVMAGVVGMWAVSFQCSRAAKLFMLSGPANLLLRVLASLQLQWSTNEEIHGLELFTTDPGVLGHALNILLVCYFFKVSWSYYKATLDHETTAHARASWNEDNRGQPMVAMNTAALV